MEQTKLDPGGTGGIVDDHSGLVVPPGLLILGRSVLLLSLLLVATTGATMAMGGLDRCIVCVCWQDWFGVGALKKVVIFPFPP